MQKKVAKGLRSTFTVIRIPKKCSIRGDGIHSTALIGKHSQFTHVLCNYHLAAFASYFKMSST
jgi:uncharacterized protein (UPF0333 family)